MIISFSGLDGAGKTTQIVHLMNAYKKRGARVGSIYSFLPDLRYHNLEDLHVLYNRLSCFDVIHIRYRLNSDRNCVLMHDLESKIPPQPILATRAAIQGYLDHKRLSEIVLKPLIHNNKTLIFDRYYYDELAFKYIYGCPDVILKTMYRKEPDSDLGFLIRISSEECIKRNRFRPDSIVSIYQSHKSILTLSKRFDCIAERKNLIVLDGTQDRETISNVILQHVSLFEENNKG